MTWKTLNRAENLAALGDIICGLVTMNQAFHIAPIPPLLHKNTD